MDTSFTGTTYAEEFEEMKCIGRGNFGAAFLVKHRNPPTDATEVHFIAKKIIYANLDEKEKKAAYLESMLLRSLDHPHIVQYKTTYVEKGELIIIMEFCEFGDLANAVKTARAKSEHFSETNVMQWFVQICMSLEYIHRRKILHRDLKTQNIFLTKNNTLKLGDFGISKVLENTNDHAMTVQGTPYYMSPEVCQNKPYTYTSDVWALGCILYELCTLKHAFSGENLLGLVFKIVQEKQEPIPDFYSQEIKELISLMLNKNEKKRPQVLDILQIPFVKQHIEMFIQSNGKVNLNPNLSVKRDIQPAVVEKMKTKDKSEMTPAERAKLNKENRAKKEFEQLKKAAIEAKLSNSIAKDLELNQFHNATGGSGLITNSQRKNIQAIGTIKQMDQGHIGTLAAGELTSSDFDANNRTMGTASIAQSTMKQSLDPNMAGRFPTEYDKKWVSRQGHAQQTKDYLQDTKHITIDFGANDGEQELPSSAQYLASPATGTVRKMPDPSVLQATYNSDRSDLEFTDAMSAGMGTQNLRQLQGTASKQQQQNNPMLETQMSAGYVTGKKQSQPYNQASPFSPAQRMHVQPDMAAGTIGTVGTSATLMKNGSKVLNDELDMSQTRMAMQQQRIEAAAAQQLKNLGPHQPKKDFSGTQTAGSQNNQLLDSFLTMGGTQTNNQEFYQNYMNQIAEAQLQKDRAMLSPIPESNSSKYDTIDSVADPNYAKRFDPNDERKIVASGSYKIQDMMDDEYENDNYSDDFCSDEDVEDDYSIRSSGCSGSTTDTTKNTKGNMNKAEQQKQLDEVVENYRKVLEESMHVGSNISESFYQNFDQSVGISAGAGAHVLPQSIHPQLNATKSALSHSESTVIGKPMAARLQDQKEKIRVEMGGELYEKVHRIL